jgi:hypothetical protein
VKFQKDRPGSPTPAGSKDKPEGRGGILGMLSGLIPAIISGIAFLGSKVISGITGAISGLGSLILQGITSALSIPNLMKVFGIAGNVISGFAKLLPILISPAFLGIVAAIAGATWLMKFLQRKNDEANTEEKINERIAADRGGQSSKMAARTLLINKDLKSLLADDRTDQDVSDYTRGEIKTKDELAQAIASAEGAGKRAIVITNSRVAADARLRLSNPQNPGGMSDEEMLARQNPGGMSDEEMLARQQPATKPIQPPDLAPISQPPSGRSSSGRVTTSPTTTKPVQVPSSTPSRVPTSTQTNGVTPGDIDPSKTTFNDLTREQQDIFMQKQREAEGFKPGSLTYDLNNPGAMLYSPWQKKYGAELDTTGRGVGTVKGLFAKFPTLQDGVEAQRALLSGKKYGDLPLEQAINQWVTGNKFSGVDTNMGGQTNTGYKNKIYAALGAPPATSTGMPTTVAAAPTRPSSSTATPVPMAPSVTLAAAAPTRPSSIISDSTVALAEVKERTSSAPIVVNAPQTVNNMQQGSQAVTQYTAPSIVDSEFMRMLVSRAV